MMDVDVDESVGDNGEHNSPLTIETNQEPTVTSSSPHQIPLTQPLRGESNPSDNTTDSMLGLLQQQTDFDDNDDECLLNDFDLSTSDAESSHSDPQSEAEVEPVKSFVSRGGSVGKKQIRKHKNFTKLIFS